MKAATGLIAAAVGLAPAASYAELLKPVPNAREAQKQDDARLQKVQFVVVPRAHHHHHHHHHHGFRMVVPLPRFHHHHHHHHHHHRYYRRYD